MNQRHLASLTLVLIGFASIALYAGDPPHWTGFSQEIDCTTACHTVHSVLQGATANVNICQSCHNPAGQASELSINSADVAIPGTTGSSHAFDVAAINGDLATQMPLDTEMQTRIMDGRIVCSTCHDQHTSTEAYGGTLRIRAPRLVAGTVDVGDGMIASGGNYTGNEGAWYLVRITQSGSESTALFQHRSFTDTNGWSSWSSDTPASSSASLSDGINISFGSGNYTVDDYWELYVSWPFLRSPLHGSSGEGSVMCMDCHRDWVMSYSDVESGDGSYMSHPVSVPLDANSRSYDRNLPLDASGAEQGSADADSNAFNDLKLDDLGNVHCLTCHDVHYADSNTTTGKPL